ncbi:MAG: leucine-rich repeat protein [Ruminococcus sp.]|nr:leucine-rich repeat protein [Ruminococcus sp.]
MKNRIISGLLTVLMCVMLIDVPSAGAEITADTDTVLAGYAERVWEIVNEERAGAGLEPINYSPPLNYVANIRASEIIGNNTHERPDGSKWYTIFDENNISSGGGGENILFMKNMFPVADVAMAEWMKSEIHRNNILNSAFTNIGIGIAFEDEIYYLVQIFSGDAVAWNISDEILSLSGTGKTPDYSMKNHPWNENIDDITSVDIGDGITETGKYLFSGINNIKSITLPESVVKIDKCSFKGCNSLEEIIFMNPDCEIEGGTETIPAGTVIYSHENSAVQAFAETYGYEFRVLEDNIYKNTANIGDVNSDGNVDAIDATAILTEYAILSTEKVSTFTDEQKTLADIDEDGQINSIDASYVLTYYAYLSTGDDVKLNMFEWLKNNPL